MILYYLLLLSLALSDQRFFDHRLFGFTVEKYLGLLCLLYALFYLGIRKSPVGLWRSWQARAFLCFLVVAEVSWLLIGGGPFHGSMALVYLSQLAFLISTLILIDSVERLRWALLAAMASVAWASLYALREWQKAVPFYGLSYRPQWSPAGGPNYLAASAVVCLPIAFYLFTRSPNRFDRWFSAACAVPIVGAMLVGASRGGLLALVAAGLVVLFQSRGRRGMMLLIGAAFAVVLLISPVSPMRRLLHPSGGDVTAANDRLELWSAGLRMVAEHPLTGIGLGNFKAEVPQYLLPGQHIDFIAHNTYIEMAADLGLPGLAIFSWILLVTFKSLTRARQRATEADSTMLYCAASGLFAGLAGFCVAMFFLSAEFLKLLWFAVFFAAAIEPLAASAASERFAVDRRPEVGPTDILDSGHAETTWPSAEGVLAPRRESQANDEARIDG